MKIMRLRSRVSQIFQGSSKGLTFVELVIAMAFIGMLAVAFLGGLSNSIMILSIAKTHAAAESLAYTQIEYVKSLPYAESYDPRIPAEYSGKDYAVSINATDLQKDEEGGMTLQEIVVVVDYSVLRYNRDTGGYQQVPQSITLEGYTYKVTDDET